MVDVEVFGGVTSKLANAVHDVEPPEPAESPSATAETTTPGPTVSDGGVVQPQKPIMPLRVRLALATRCALASSPSTPGYPLSTHVAVDEFWNSSTMPTWPAAPPPGGLVQVTLIWLPVHAAGPAGELTLLAGDELLARELAAVELLGAGVLEVAGVVDAVPLPASDDVQADSAPIAKAATNNPPDSRIGRRRALREITK